MSILALMTAVRNYIRTGTGDADCHTYDVKTCDIAPPNGQPPPGMGQYYVAIHEGNVGGETSYSTFEELYAVNVTITVRMHGPWDRVVQQILYGANSLEDRASQIAALIHQDTYDHRVINAATALINPPAVGYNKYIFNEPLRFAGTDQAVQRGPDWFHATMNQMESGNVPTGWSKTVRFTGARRVQETMFAEEIGVVS